MDCFLQRNVEDNKKKIMYLYIFLKSTNSVFIVNSLGYCHYILLLSVGYNDSLQKEALQVKMLLVERVMYINP